MNNQSPTKSDWVIEMLEKDALSIPKKPRIIDNRNCIGDYFGKFLADELGFNIITGPWLAGGAVRKSFLGQTIENSDWDIWLSSHTQFAHAEKKLANIGATVVHRSQNSITFKYSGHSVYDASQTIQLVKKRYYSSPEEIINNFDFTVCQLVTDGRSMVMGEKTLHDLNRRLIRHTSTTLAKNVINRMVKYIVYGYQPTPELLDLIDKNFDQIDLIGYTHEYGAV